MYVSITLRMETNRLGVGQQTLLRTIFFFFMIKRNRWPETRYASTGRTTSLLSLIIHGYIIWGIVFSLINQFSLWKWIRHAYVGVQVATGEAYYMGQKLLEANYLIMCRSLRVHVVIWSIFICLFNLIVYRRYGEIFFSRSIISEI